MKQKKKIFDIVYKKFFQEKKFTYPLYKYADEYEALVCMFMNAFVNIPRKDPIHEQLKSFHLLSIIRLIFESNRIENSGVSLSETRKLILDFYPEIPSTYKEFKNVDAILLDDIFSKKRMLDFFQSLKESGIPEHSILPTFQFGDQSRSMLEVSLHYIGFLRLESEAYKFISAREAFLMATAIKRNYSEDLKSKWEEAYPELDFDKIKFPNIFSEELIKTIHGKIARGLLPQDSGVEAGEYRTDERAAGLETVFVSYKLIPDAMKYFINQSNELMEACFNPMTTAERLNPIEASSKISHHFVRIHPFPDFNGRLSRLLLAFVCSCGRLPFAVSLRGNGRDKQRYIAALKIADRGDLKYYRALISKTILDSILEIDSNIEAAGIKTFTDTLNEYLHAEIMEGKNNEDKNPMK